MLDGGIEPGVTVEHIVTASEISSSGDGFAALWVQLISREHFLNHAVVSFVFVQGVYNPVAPVPEMFLAVAKHTSKSVPIRISPNIHPVPAPSFSVMWAGKQLIDCVLMACIREELLSRGWQTNQVEIKTS